MKISGEKIAQFFTQEIPKAATAAKSRILEVWNTATLGLRTKSNNKKTHPAEERKWTREGKERPIISKPIHLDALQREMFLLFSESHFVSNKRASEQLSKLLTWVSNPISLEKLKAVLALKPTDKVLFLNDDKTSDSTPRDNTIPKQYNTLLNTLDTLANLQNAYDNRFNFKTCTEILELFNRLQIIFGNFAIHDNGGLLTTVQSEVDVILNAINPEALAKVDVAICKTALQEWKTRESWTVEQMQIRYPALKNVAEWLVQGKDLLDKKPLSPQLLAGFPVIGDIQQLCNDFPVLNEISLGNTSTPGEKDLNGLNPQHPIRAISDKIKALSSTLPNHSKKEDRLTLREFYLLKQVYNKKGQCPYWLSQETFNQWQTFTALHLLLPKTSVVLVQAINRDFPKEFREEFENRTLLTTLKMRVGERLLGTHMNMAIQPLDGRITRIGMGVDGVYNKTLNGLVNPKLQTFELNIDQLAQGLPEEKRNQFKKIFSEKLFEATNKTLTFPESFFKERGFLKFQPRFNPSGGGFAQDQKTSICSEFVMRCIIEATVLSFKELGVTPPDSAKYFGLHQRENLKTLTPATLQRRLIKKGILKPLNNIEQIIRF